ncbi:UbiD family decarboxylase [Streptomyces brevispora]|uniref:UbiD family decarboxylase n=1 Tax=Streptomyces brevispora TaxID=887462 RepID=UPI0033FAC66C
MSRSLTSSPNGWPRPCATRSSRSSSPPRRLPARRSCTRPATTASTSGRCCLRPPTPTRTRGPYFCEALVLGSDPETGHTDVTIHRLCVQGKDEISTFFAPGRHIDAFRQKAEAKGEALPISIDIGLDPAVYIGAEFEAPTTPLGFDELTIGGGLRGEGVELFDCLTAVQKSIARSEIVIEGEILPNVRGKEDQNTGTGHAMSELPGCDGPANPALPLIKVKAVTQPVLPMNSDQSRWPLLHSQRCPGFGRPPEPR